MQTLPKSDSMAQGTAAAVDSAGAAATATTAMPLPEMRTPENGKYLKLGYLAASTIYISYLVIMYRRWSALRSRQKRSAANSGH